jgi:excisionase family DNA binding protein
MNALQQELAEVIAPLRAEVKALREELAAMRAPASAWVSVTEAAEVLGVSNETVRRRIRAGEIASRGAGRGLMVERASL